jgi:hypothetical protein
MKNIFKILILLLLLVGCKKEITPADVAKLNGYWEIKKVVFDSGKDKDYDMNESFDYFEIANNKGFRKKVMPQLNGTFLVNNTSEKIRVRFVNHHAFLDYTTPYTKWSEELLVLTDSVMVLENAQKIKYNYKKTGAINILENGKKIK